MKTILAMDESGNTHQIAAIALASIPYNKLPKINELFSLSKSDPEEIHILYTKKSNGEFKYTDLRNAFRQTQLQVYDNFLREKLKEIRKLDIQVYLSVFPNAENNEERLNRLVREAQDLLLKWAHQNQEAAFSKELEINADQQIFPEKYIFQYYFRRGRYICQLFPNRYLKEEKVEKIYADKENAVEIKDQNSKSIRSIQLSDILVGCARENFVTNVTDYFELIKPLFKKEHMQVQLDNYQYSKRGFINFKKLGEW